MAVADAHRSNSHGLGRRLLALAILPFLAGSGCARSNEHAEPRAEASAVVPADSRGGRLPAALSGSSAAGRVQAPDERPITDDPVLIEAMEPRRCEARLTSNGVDFGVLRADANGEIDTSGLDEDLVAKPLGWKGTRPGRFPSVGPPGYSLRP